MKYILCFTLSLILTFSYSEAQISRKFKDHGDKLMAAGDAQGALKNYHLGMLTDSSDADLQFAYATALRLTNNYKKSAHYYKSVQRSDRNRKFTESSFYAGQMYKCLGQYKNAQKETKRFLKRYKGDKQSFEFEKASYDMEHWDELIHLMKDTINMSISNQHSVNTAFSEFSGFFVNDTSLLFSTLRSDSLKNTLVLDSAQYYSRIHQSIFKQEWVGKGRHESFQLDERINLANATLDPRGEYVYYSECQSNMCQIYRAKNNNGVWSDFKALPDEINLPGYTNTQPIVARINGYDILYFVSDRPGGYGKLDIWYTIAYSNGLFERPSNLGERINTKGNEISPYFLDEESALYFSSDWYVGLGGFDIFRTILINEEYTEPENMGVPLNSSFNDLYFRYHNYQAVLTSNREGSLSDKFENCCNDLYFLSYEPKIKKPVIELTNLEKIEKLLPLRLYFNNDEPNPRSNDTISTFLYSATYIQYVSKIPQYQREYSKGLNGFEKLEAEEEIELFFDNEVTLGFSDLDKVLGLIIEELKEGKSVELSIKGYASPLSKSDYNRRLTLRRINSVQNEMMHFEKGELKKYIENGRLKLVLYPFGEDKLSQKVSDDLNDKRNAIYSKKAAFERRVEIVAIQIE